MPDIEAMTEDEFWAMLCDEMRQSLDALEASFEDATATLASFEATVARIDRRFGC